MLLFAVVGEENKMKRRSTCVLFRYIGAFIMVLLIPIIVMVTMYYQVMQSLKDQAFFYAVRTIKSSAENMERIFQELPLVIYTLSMDEKLSTFITMENYQDDQTVISDVLLAQKHLNTYSTVYSDISNIQIFSQKNNMIIDSTSSGIDLDRYYGIAFGFSGISEQEWETDYLNQTFNSYIIPAKDEVLFRGKKERRLIYAHTIQKIHGNANVFIYLNTLDLLSQYNTLPYQNRGFVSVRREENQELLLYDSSENFDFNELDYSQMIGDEGYVVQDLGGRKMLVTYLVNHVLGWRYVVGTPIEALLEPISEIRKAIIMLIIFSVILATVLSLMAAFQVSKPERSIYKSLTAKYPERHISGKKLSIEISNIIYKNESMQKEFELQQSILRNAVVNNFLLGMFTDKEEVKLRFEQCGMQLKNGIYGLLIIKMQIPQIQSIQEQGMQKMLVREILTNNIPNHFAFSDLDSEKFILLLNTSSTEVELLKGAVNQGLEKCIQELQRLSIRSINVHGLLTDRLSVIPPMFTHIKIEMTQKSFDDSLHEAVWYELTELNSAYYPLEIELKLISAVRSGNISSLMQTFQFLKSVNSILFIDSQMSAEAYRFIEAVYATLLRHNILGDTEQKHEILEKIKEQVCPNEVYQMLSSLYIETALMSSKQTVKISFKKDIVQYVEENFTDAQISLRSVSEHFHITEVYFSKLFKQESGINFVKYLEKLRIEKAEELLKKTDLKIGEIAKLVGYNSTQVFRRAYKRFFNCDDKSDLQEKKYAE